MRRILSLGDEGDDVRMVQHALNWALITLPPVSNPLEEWPNLGKRDYPELWGYQLKPGVMDDGSGPTRAVTPKLKLTLPLSLPPRINESGTFDFDTYLGVCAFQRRQQLPDTGDVDSLTWNRLFPWFVIGFSLHPIQNVPKGSQPDKTTATVFQLTYVH